MTRTLSLPSAEATEGVASAIAPHLRAGDCLLLSGPLGAGKTAFARALIGKRLGAIGRRDDIPSPSYTLVQIYDLADVELWHADLYRLGDTSEIDELGLDDAFATAITLVEWGERLGGRAPARSLVLRFDFPQEGGEGRTLVLDPRGSGWDWLECALGTDWPVAS